MRMDRPERVARFKLRERARQVMRGPLDGTDLMPKGNRGREPSSPQVTNDKAP